MRDNGPVTQREVPMADGSVIVSRTDEKGRIVFINRDFIDISGFAKEELIGQPHNLIRHCDMPPEAFKDMWRDLQAGMPWTGYVKNRVKNGDHYWVRANAMPEFENGRITGFLSIRNKPEQQTTKIVGDIYKKFIEGNSGSLAIEHGLVVDNSSKGKFKRWYKKIGSKVTCLSISMFSLIIIIGGIGVYSLNNASQGFRSMYEDGVIASGQLADISRFSYDNVVNLSLLAAGAHKDTNMIISNIKENENKISEIWTSYMTTHLGSEEMVVANKFASSYKDFSEVEMRRALELVKAGASDDLITQMININDSFKVISELNNDLIELKVNAASKEYLSAKKEHMIDFIIIAVSVILATLTAFISSRKIKALLINRISYVDSCLGSIARGNLTTNIEIIEDELQTSLGLINALQAKLFYSDLERKNLTEEAHASKLKLADDFEQRTAGIIKSLAAAATEMQATAAQMTAASNNTAHASQIVASAAAEADSNVQTVAAATEELSASSSEIARQISSVSEKSNRASSEAVLTSQQVGDLNSLADSIGEVVGAIKGIAEQTNLLALNATIEAARAGEAGKGFAVVADEVKKLATETAAKTIQIDERVGKIQAAIRGTVEAVGRIINDVKEIDHSTATVASAVEEQNAATAEIGRNVSEASTGTQQVAENITNVQRSAEETGEAASNLNAAANELAEIAENLQEQVGSFLTEIRSS